MESLFNSTFDHKGLKSVVPFAKEADAQTLLTMLIFTYLSGGNPTLFMDFRRVWESSEIQGLAKNINLEIPAIIIQAVLAIVIFLASNQF